MIKCVPEKSFRCKDGQLFSSPMELARALKGMEFSSFRFHVTESKNDFAKWIEDVFGIGELGKLVRNSKTKAETAHSIQGYFNRNDVKTKAFFEQNF